MDEGQTLGGDEAMSLASGNGNGAAHGVKKRVGDAVQQVRRATNDARDALGRTASNVTQYAQAQMSRARRGMGQAQRQAIQFYDDSPLTSGALALGVGAAIGLALPLSRTERERLRVTADTAARKVADLAERGAQAIQRKDRDKTSAVYGGGLG
jgi:Holliday junction resolvasome RuvABC endonuclease subunit